MPDRAAEVYVQGVLAGLLYEHEGGKTYSFRYLKGYTGQAVSLTMPVREETYRFDTFPPFFDGLLPEGIQLESLLRRCKIDKNDYFSQLVAVGADMVGCVTVFETGGTEQNESLPDYL